MVNTLLFCKLYYMCRNSSQHCLRARFLGRFFFFLIIILNSLIIVCFVPKMPKNITGKTFHSSIVTSWQLSKSRSFFVFFFWKGVDRKLSGRGKGDMKRKRIQPWTVYVTYSKNML